MKAAVTITAATAAFVVLVLLGASPPSQVQSAAAATGSAIVFGADQEPRTLNTYTNEGNAFIGSVITGAVVPGAFRLRPDRTYEPMLVEKVDVQTQPFRLTYHVRENANWSDGTPVTADDFIYMYESVMTNAVVTRAGYELVTEVTKLGPKTVRFTFGAPYPAWQTLFPRVYPSHLVAGRDFGELFRGEIANPVTHEPIASGPFLLESWNHGTSLTLVRNPRWWGARGPLVERVVLRFIPDTNVQFQAFRLGEVDVITPQPQLQIADLRRLPGVVVQDALAGALEHIDFNVGSTTMPLLQQPWFRQAVAHSFDRSSVGTALYATLLESLPAQQSLIFHESQPAYVPHFARYGYDPGAVAALMTANGCVLGADGIWVCDGVRASVKLATTPGNQLRELAQSVIAEQARAAGIEILPDNSADILTVRLPARNYEAALFAWVLSAVPNPFLHYGCNGIQNWKAYCSTPVTDLLTQAAVEIDVGARDALFDEADALLAEDVPTIPIFLRPAFLLHWSSVHGVQLNTADSPLWNVEEWRLGEALDTTAPVTTAAATPPANASGWHAGSVAVVLTAADEVGGSGLRNLSYTLTGAQTGGGVVYGTTAGLSITAEGVTTLEYRARDFAGNVEPAQTLAVRIDRTPPTASCAAMPNRLWPANKQFVPVEVAVGVADTGSGAAGFVLDAVASDEPAEGDIRGFTVGAADTSGELRAERDRRGDGRVYTLRYVASDLAGNTATCTASVEVPRRR